MKFLSGEGVPGGIEKGNRWEGNSAINHDASHAVTKAEDVGFVRSRRKTRYRRKEGCNPPFFKGSPASPPEKAIDGKIR